MTRYYPGFFAALSIILLRIAIGWHFLTEGSEKYESIGRGKEAFSAEIYLRNANGPLAPYFRELLPDADGREALDESKLKESWRRDVDRIAAHLRFAEAQRSEASKLLDEAERWVDHWFSDGENREKSKKYLHELDQIEATEKNPQAMSFERERASDARGPWTPTAAHSSVPWKSGARPCARRSPRSRRASRSRAPGPSCSPGSARRRRPRRIAMRSRRPKAPGPGPGSTGSTSRRPTG